MSSLLPTIILRHRKENLKKCSLSGLENRSDLLFYKYPIDPFPTLSNYILLTLTAPPLTINDNNYGLFLIDSTWKYAEVMEKHIPKKGLLLRSIPSEFRTAYPRKQTACPDPSRGLSSIEALFIAYQILGRNNEGLLDHYYWKEAFLTLNRENL